MTENNRNQIVKIWIKRSKDQSRTRAQRNHAWKKALELAADAPDYEVWTCENNRQELHRIVASWQTPARAGKVEYYKAGKMIQTVRIYRTREDGKPRALRAVPA